MAVPSQHRQWYARCHRAKEYPIIPAPLRRSSNRWSATAPLHAPEQRSSQMRALSKSAHTAVCSRLQWNEIDRHATAVPASETAEKRANAAPLLDRNRTNFAVPLRRSFGVWRYSHTTTAVQANDAILRATAAAAISPCVSGEGCVVCTILAWPCGGVAAACGGGVVPWGENVMRRGGTTLGCRAISERSR